MKVIVLAAGEGRRLRPYTENNPKCMVLFEDKPIIDYILDSIMNCKIKIIAMVSGYKAEVLKKHIKENHNEKEVVFFNNSYYDTTNMVYSLFCAEEFLDETEDVIISYSDIIYSTNVLNKLKESDDDIAVVVDKDWKRLWEQRMENPLEDAETMKVDDEGYINELGKKPNSYDDIQGQYIGLIKLSKNVLNRVKEFYYSLDRESLYDGKSINNMYMTSFIQLLIDNGFKVKAVEVFGGWLEIDTVEDLERLKGYNF